MYNNLTSIEVSYSSLQNDFYSITFGSQLTSFSYKSPFNASSSSTLIYSRMPNYVGSYYGSGKLNEVYREMYNFFNTNFYK